MHLKGAEQHVILMDTISKRYSACGGRIGAFITKNKTVLEAAMKFAQARLSPPFYAQVLGEAAVDLPADYFDKTKKEYKLRRDTLVPVSYTHLDVYKRQVCMHRQMLMLQQLHQQ